jgi:predicted dehydrogenase
VLLQYASMIALSLINWSAVPMPGLDTVPGLPVARQGARFELEGESGTLALDVRGRLVLQQRDRRQTWNFPPDSRARSRTACQQHFVDGLRGRAELETTGRDYLETMALVHGAYHSAAIGRPVPAAALLGTHHKDVGIPSRLRRRAKSGRGVPSWK